MAKDRYKKKNLEAIESGDMNALRDSLSYRQRRFCEEFIVDFNATAAAIRAGYKPGSYVDRQASQLLHHKGCAAYIDHLQKEKEGKIVSVNPEYVIQKAIKNIDKAEDTNNLSAVFRGLELLARHLGMLTDKQEITGKDGGALEIEQRVREEADNFTKLLKSLSSRQKRDVEIVE